MTPCVNALFEREFGVLLLAFKLPPGRGRFVQSYFSKYLWSRFADTMLISWEKRHEVGLSALSRPPGYSFPKWTLDNQESLVSFWFSWGWERRLNFLAQFWSTTNGDYLVCSLYRDLESFVSRKVTKPRVYSFLTFFLPHFFVDDVDFVFVLGTFLKAILIIHICFPLYSISRIFPICLANSLSNINGPEVATNQWNKL